MGQTKLSGVSGCSDAVSQGSPGSTRSTELILGKCHVFVFSHTMLLSKLNLLSLCGLSPPSGVKSIPEDAPAGRVLLRKEVLRLVVNLSSSVGTKGHETNLLT